MDISLSDDHELQVQAYLRFAKLKRAQHVREALAVITEFKDDRLTPGEMYNYTDIKGLLDDMSVAMKNLVDKEIQHAYHTNALLVKILLSQAQANGLELQVDTNTLENEFLLKQIAASEATAVSRPASDFVRRNTQLGKIGTVSTINMSDPKTAKERDALGAELQTTKQRLEQMQQQTTQMMRERTAVNNELNALKDELAAKNAALQATQSGQNEMLSKMQRKFASLSTQAAGAAQVSGSQFEDLKRQLNETRGDLEETRRKLARAQDEINAKDAEMRGTRDTLDGRLMESKQFQQMKKMMQQKSNEVVELRKRLGRYEPQHIPSADDS